MALITDSLRSLNSSKIGPRPIRRVRQLHRQQPNQISSPSALAGDYYDPLSNGPNIHRYPRRRNTHCYKKNFIPAPFKPRAPRPLSTSLYAFRETTNSTRALHVTHAIRVPDRANPPRGTPVPLSNTPLYRNPNSPINPLPTPPPLLHPSPPASKPYFQPSYSL
jgi:hypothetical protein